MVVNARQSTLTTLFAALRAWRSPFTQHKFDMITLNLFNECTTYHRRAS